jgi:hypothetical protein
LSAPVLVPPTRPASLSLAPPSSPPPFCKWSTVARGVCFLCQPDGVFSLALRQVYLAFFRALDLQGSADPVAHGALVSIKQSVPLVNQFFEAWMANGVS